MGGFKAVWNVSENSSDLVAWPVPETQHNLVFRKPLSRHRCCWIKQRSGSSYIIICTFLYSVLLMSITIQQYRRTLVRNWLWYVVLEYVWTNAKVVYQNFFKIFFVGRSKGFGGVQCLWCPESIVSRIDGGQGRKVPPSFFCAAAFILFFHFSLSPSTRFLK